MSCENILVARRINANNNVNYSPNIHVFFLQMRIALLVLAACAVALADPAINQIRPVSNRPGRFLSLPNPQKCANSKWTSRLFNTTMKYLAYQKNDCRKRKSFIFSPDRANGVNSLYFISSKIFYNINHRHKKITWIIFPCLTLFCSLLWKRLFVSLVIFSFHSMPESALVDCFPIVSVCLYCFRSYLL